MGCSVGATASQEASTRVLPLTCMPAARWMLDLQAAVLFIKNKCISLVCVCNASFPGVAEPLWLLPAPPVSQAPDGRAALVPEPLVFVVVLAAEERGTSASASSALCELMSAAVCLRNKVWKLLIVALCFCDSSRCSSVSQHSCRLFLPPSLAFSPQLPLLLPSGFKSPVSSSPPALFS